MRTQFTWFESFSRAAQRIKNKVHRCAFYDIVTEYALYEKEPDMDNLPDSVAIAFELIKPNLDASKRKAANGKAGGSRKQTASKTEANAKQTASEKEIENEIEKENEIEIEIESKEPAAPTPTPEPHKFGDYGWVKLTDEEYNRLLKDLGEREAARCIQYVDESAQATGNKNKWKDWNLVVRKCHREKWGANRQQTAAKTGNPFLEMLEEERMR